MARSTGMHLVLPAVLCFAANSLAADTGMLYVKSFPAGASVVIEGKERGKTPILVRDLPAGEVTVELRIAGVKPVTKVATVEANKVATIDVAIEVPGASLTIVSEPLEATVVLDGREVGKTPLTLEHLDPGEHSLLLLKDGHPRTARSVVLGPGAERVLEVKLGTAGEDETVRPAAGASVAKAAKSVPVEVQLILTMLKDAVAKGDYAETRRNLALALGQPDMANVKEELCAAIRVVEALETRQRHVRKGAEALVGREATLRTKTGPRSGKVEGVTFEGITIASKIIIDSQAAGETRGTVKWSALALAEQDRLAESWKPEGLDGAVARAILAQAGRDTAAAERAVREAGEHPLGKYLGGGGAAVAGPAEEDPTKLWARIAKKYRARRVTAVEEVALDREIRAFKDRYGRAGLDPSLRRHIRLAAERAKRASGLVGHWTFDEGGGTVARDSSGRGNHGRARGARWVKGKLGGALNFDGKDDYVDCGNRPSLLVQGDMTLSIWVKPDTLSGERGLASKWRSSWCWVLGPSGENLGKSALFFNRWKVANTTVPIGQWSHLAIVYSDAQDKMYFYYNGRLDGMQHQTVNQGTGANLTIGQRGHRRGGGQGWLKGLIDDVRIYNRALSAEEVKALATAAE